MKLPAFLVITAFTAIVPAALPTPSTHRMPLVATVSTTRDRGPGSLRAAIESANHNATTRILFRLPMTDPNFVAATHLWKIAPLSPLPALQKPGTYLEADGSILISGENVRENWSALHIKAPRCRVIGLKWANWSSQIISIQASHTRIERNQFSLSPRGICVQGATSRRNSFTQNLFEGVGIPIWLQDNGNDAIAPPMLSIVRSDTQEKVNHLFTIGFRGKAKTKVTIELAYSPNEARDEPQIQTIKETHTLRTDDKGIAQWQFNRKGYPVGSWVALATQNGNTSAVSNTVVMPYL